MKNGYPVAAIIGRPNVGKSSLFNMLIGERKSIVDEMEGVTRDINMALVTGEKVPFYIYDTAGYLEKGDEFNKLVQEKVKQAVDDAEIVLFMVDGREYHPLDEQLAVFLSKQNKPVVVVANKLDNMKMAEDAIYEFYNLGFAEVMPFSVMQRRGFRELTERIQKQFKKFKPPKVKEKEIRVAIVGKPNVGKSCLINSLLGYERSIVSPVPGTTRDPLDDFIEFGGHVIRLIDTAGLRRKNKVDEDIEYYSNNHAVHAIEASHVVIQLFDADEPVAMQDKRITQLVLDRGRAFVAVFNKWDLVGSRDPKINYEKMQEFRKTFADEFPALAFVPIEFVSAKDEYKIERLMETVLKVYADYQFRVPTAELNKWVERELKESRTDKRTTNLNVYYVTQTYTAPPRFVFFINSKDNLRKDHARHFENKLREAFEFRGTPINITFREKGEKVED